MLHRQLWLAISWLMQIRSRTALMASTPFQVVCFGGVKADITASSAKKSETVGQPGAQADSHA